MMGGIVPMEARAGGQVKMMAVIVCFTVVFPLSMIFVPRMIRLFAYGDISKEELMERTRKMKLIPSHAKNAGNGKRFSHMPNSSGRSGSGDR